jgi:hypothetical protein
MGMPITNTSFLSLTGLIKETLDKIKELAPKTNSNVVKRLNVCLDALGDESFDNSKDLPVLEKLLATSEQLISNLEYAKKAVDFTSTKLVAANIPPVSRTDNAALEQTRKQINDTELVKQFQFLKSRRSNLAESLKDSSLTDFDQKFYRKGPGCNIRRWAQYAMDDSKGPSQKLGNCTEQANLSFSYLYTSAYGNITDKKNTPFNSIERIDVNNNIGGHSFLMMDRNKKGALKPQNIQSVYDFIHGPDFGDTCVIVDPWNKANPFYPASDIEANMPPCGLVGTVDVEFGLDFSQQDAPDTQPAPDTPTIGL